MKFGRRATKCSESAGAGLVAAWPRAGYGPFANDVELTATPATSPARKHSVRALRQRRNKSDPASPGP